MARSTSVAADQDLDNSEPVLASTKYHAWNEGRQLSIETFAEKLEQIERRLGVLESARYEPDRFSLKSNETVAEFEQNTPAQRQSHGQSQILLQRAGFSDTELDMISTTRDRLQLSRLQLRDAAIREGWFRTDAWFEEVRKLDRDSHLRESLGDQRFDDYLLAIGRSNRVKVDELLRGSVAEQSGVLPGDVIHRYAERRVFDVLELRNLTTGGQIGEYAAMTVLRNGELIDLIVPRGPLGVLISAASHGRSVVDSGGH